METVSLVAVAAGAIGAMVLGAVWYSPALFAKQWMTETGVTEADAEKSNVRKIMATTFLLNIIAAYMFGLFIGPEPGLVDAVRKGLYVGLFFVASCFAISYMFEGKSMRLWLINGLHHTLQFVIYGVAFGLLG